MGNFFGGSLSLGIGAYTTDRQMDPGDNGVYVIEDWRIADHLRTEYDADWNPIGMRSFEPSEEEDWHKFNEMLHAFDEAMPEGLRLGPRFVWAIRSGCASTNPDTSSSRSSAPARTTRPGDLWALPS